MKNKMPGSKKERKYGSAVVYDKENNILYNISEVDAIKDEANIIIKRANEGLKYHALSLFDVRTVLQILSDRGLLSVKNDL